MPKFRWARPLAALPFLAPLGATPHAHAQTVDMQTLQHEIESLRQSYDSKLGQMKRDYQQRIDRLQADLSAQAAQQKMLTAAPQAVPAPAAAPAAAPSAPVGANSFNPAIGVVLLGTVANSSRDPDTYRIPGFALGEEAKPRPRGLAIDESEVTFQANIDQALYGSLVLSLDRENNPSVEEGYVQTTSLPEGFTLKGGRFYSHIGYLNDHHTHTLDFVDRPLAYRAMLNDQYGDDGVQVSWLAPTDMYLQLGTELFRGDSFPAAGAANRGFGSYTAFLHAGDDIGVESSWTAGLSFLTADAKDRLTNDDTDTFKGTTRLGIFDAVYKWAPNGNPVERNLKLQGEFLLGDVDGTFNGIPFTQQQRGFYVQAVYQFMPQWRVGVRQDVVWADGAGTALVGTALDDQGDVPRRTSAMIDYSTSEFGRFRLQYNYDLSQPGEGADHQILFQYNVSLGAHGAHAY